jgi:hypothetical protein
MNDHFYCVDRNTNYLNILNRFNENMNIGGIISFFKSGKFDKPLHLLKTVIWINQV